MHGKTLMRLYVNDLRWERLQVWRKQGSVTRIERPTRIDRARSLGYKAKQGIVVARVKVRRGGLGKTRFNRGRRTQKMGVNKITGGMNIQRIAEARADRKSRTRVLNFTVERMSTNVGSYSCRSPPPP